LWEYAATHPIDELMQKALDGIGELTGSSIGFYHFVEADQKTLSLQAWSTRTLNEFCQAEGKGLHYSIDEAGVWVDCVHQRKPVIHNDYAALPHRKGMPAGHAQVIRELVVPTLRDGRVVSILGVGNKPSDYDGQDVEFVSYIADVTWTIVERKRMEDDLHKAKEAAEAANRAKSVFLANMSHELRTPLNAILGFSDLMARDRSLSAEQQENLSIITRSGGHLLSLINDVLDMAKIESGRMTLQEHTFDLYHLLDGMMDLFRARAADKGLTLILNRAPDVPRYVVSDEGKLRQILINLLGNAVKLTEEGGISLRVRAKTKDEGQNTDQAARPSPSVVRLVFEVQDTGPGILPQEIEAIFEPFVQSARGKPTTPGTGLGLAISRQFARLMGGDLIAASVEATGIGALFELDLPVRLADVTGLAGLEQPEKARAIGLAPSQPAYRLLVVEDREENRQLLVKLLTRFGFEVRTAENGLQAIQVWQDWQPHLIWMDMRMPVMDGHEATQRIKAMAQGQSIVIIALTATAFEEDRDLVLAEGCDDFVRKPFREGEIVDKLVKHLGVQFIYEGAAGGPAMPQPPPEALDLAGLPADWVASLRQATMEADADRIMALAEQMREQRPAVASALANLASDFDYAAILSAIQERH
jgi:two-component system sensor histidine kinase/response regulator